MASSPLRRRLFIQIISNFRSPDPKILSTGERVYCYELYHLVRCRWPSDFRFSLSGEVDKAGHPLIRGNGLDRAKPDFIIHVPGDMVSNVLVMEVKAFTLNQDKIRSDLRKLTAFRRSPADYHAAYYLVYGASSQEGESFAVICTQVAQDDEKIELDSIDLLIHESAGTSAERHPWPHSPKGKGPP